MPDAPGLELIRGEIEQDNPGAVLDTSFDRDQAALVVDPAQLLAALAWLREAPAHRYRFLSSLHAADYSATMNYLKAVQTAGTTDSVAIDPPESGPSGSVVSPSAKVTDSRGRPRVSAAICVMIVYVPVPMSAVPLLTASRPSAVSTALAAVGM